MTHTNNASFVDHVGVSSLNYILTFDMVSASGSSCGSAQSTMISQPHTFTRPVPRRLLARDAALWDSYSKKQNPLFFFLSSGEL